MKNNNALFFVIIIVLAFAGYVILTMPDQRTAGERAGDAIDALDQGKGVGDAAKQLEKRTPGEKLGDTIKENTDNQ